MTVVSSRFVVIDGIRTHYLEAGDPAAPSLILLHGGEFGASAELAYEQNIGPLGRTFHVVAPDMIGYGKTDKLVEFGLPFARRHDRRLRHLRSFLGALDIETAAFVGNSVAGAMLAMDAASAHPLLPATHLVSISGFAATRAEARTALLGFDGTTDSMRRLLGVLFHDEKWLAEDYVARRMASATEPGAYEAAASARLRLPSAEPPAPPPGGDPTSYEKIDAPTLIVIGAHEKCCPDWGPDAARRLPRGRLVPFENSAHCAHLEEPALFNRVLADFLTGR